MNTKKRPRRETRSTVHTIERSTWPLPPPEHTDELGEILGGDLLGDIPSQSSPAMRYPITDHIAKCGVWPLT